MVNEQYAQHYWPNQDPIGKRFQLRAGEARRPGSTIVGVAKTSKYLWLAEPPTEFVYLPYRQDAQSEMVLLTESAGDPSSLVAPLRDVVQSLDPTQPIYNVRTMDEFYQMRTITIFNVIIGIVARHGHDGPRPGHRRPLRPGGLRDQPANERDRHSDGASAPAATRSCGWSYARDSCWRSPDSPSACSAGVGAERLLQAAFPERRQQL